MDVPIMTLFIISLGWCLVLVFGWANRGSTRCYLKLRPRENYNGKKKKKKKKLLFDYYIYARGWINSDAL